MPVRLIPVSRKANNPRELMTGTASLIESSFCYDSGYPWQLVQSWAFVCPCVEQHKVTFSKSFCSSHHWKVTQDFCKSLLCWIGSYCSGKCRQETCNLLWKESPSESTPGNTWGSSAKSFQHHNLDLGCSGVSLSTQVSAESRKLPREKAIDESLLASSVTTQFWVWGLACTHGSQGVVTANGANYQSFTWASFAQLYYRIHTTSWSPCNDLMIPSSCSSRTEIVLSRIWVMEEW